MDKWKQGQMDKTDLSTPTAPFLIPTVIVYDQGQQGAYPPKIAFDDLLFSVLLKRYSFLPVTKQLRENNIQCSWGASATLVVFRGDTVLTIRSRRPYEIPDSPAAPTYMAHGTG
ncbi:Hypothetical predicted protein [Pelobates cultripes]|uniref:Uncharacterized protein n=1 Tax=Pelobates cultripes TaxID=61616 RepID=A0AAD1WLF1_PELCU|nr:Hypothetical predicted protein [Pelobates cultripes]